MTEPPEVLTYRLEPAGYGAAARRQLLRQLAFVVPIMAGVVGLELWLFGRLSNKVDDVMPYVVPFVAVMLAAGFIRGIRAQLQKGRRNWDTYQLAVSPNVLRRFTDIAPPVEIVRTEVKRIIESKTGGLTVATADRYRFIFIPRELVGFADVRGRLATWAAFESPRSARNATVGLASTVLLVGSWIATGIVPDIRLAMLAGACLLAFAIYVIRETLKMRHVDAQQRAKTIAGMGFLMLAPLARLFMHVAFHVDPRWPG